MAHQWTGAAPEDRGEDRDEPKQAQQPVVDAAEEVGHGRGAASGLAAGYGRCCCMLVQMLLDGGSVVR
jgi:hypothetical protein